jgi:hypothetical protein
MARIRNYCSQAFVGTAVLRNVRRLTRTVSPVIIDPVDASVIAPATKKASV